MYPFTRYAAMTLSRPRWTTKRRALRTAVYEACVTGADIDVMCKSRRGYSLAYTAHA